MNNEAWEEEQMSNLGCESVGDLIAELKRLRHDVISILQAVDLPDYDEFPLTQEELRNMMVKYGQGHLIHEVKKND